jgi:hypothetical protein
MQIHSVATILRWLSRFNACESQATALPSLGLVNVNKQCTSSTLALLSQLDRLWRRESDSSEKSKMQPEQLWSHIGPLDVTTSLLNFKFHAHRSSSRALFRFAYSEKSKCSL